MKTLDPLWARDVLDAEGLGEWRVYISPHGCMSRCNHATKELVSSTTSSFLMEVAHAHMGPGKGHEADWRGQLARLVETYTVPICCGCIGLEYTPP